TCGGCAYLDQPYQQQLRLKSERLRAALAGLWDAPVEVRPSPDIFAYRNKMEFGFSHQVRAKNEDGSYLFEDCLGMKSKGRWDKAVDLQECRLCEDSAASLLAAVRVWAADNSLAYYDLRRHTGFLRHLVLRRGVGTGRHLVALLTAPGELPAESFVQAVRGVYSDAGVLWGVNHSVSDVAASPELKILAGPEFITEKIAQSAAGGLGALETEFKITLRAFFQTNTRAASLLYAHVRGQAFRGGCSVCFDLYGGSGAISLMLRDVADKCVCVETVADAVEDGRVNAAANGAGNIEFVNAKVEDYLPQAVAALPDACVVLDPPRAGLHARAIGALLESRPQSIIYVSCNPDALARDLKALAQSYKIDSIVGFDLFPHTVHVESVAVLQLK
ncbi:MAG TPA: 23S rRNA (uracil(1939)-C(5))-methyltransferase RlmD, partial [Elusimicrobiales bacterium]|nr:23S rRNA (uracil(1939)-C(5))-methyltransferase RlmD [Elusimicrobiales bacterium]